MSFLPALPSSSHFNLAKTTSRHWLPIPHWSSNTAGLLCRHADIPLSGWADNRTPQCSWRCKILMITRRDLFVSGIALSASSLLARSDWAGSLALPGADALESPSPVLAAVAPREQLLFDYGWKFKFGHGTDPSKDLNFGYGQADFAKTGEFKFAKADFDDSDWRSLHLPHDWAVELPFVHDDSGSGDNPLRSHGYKPLGRRYPENSVGWYRRESRSRPAMLAAASGLSSTAPFAM